MTTIPASDIAYWDEEERRRSDRLNQAFDHLYNHGAAAIQAGYPGEVRELQLALEGLVAVIGSLNKEVEALRQQQYKEEA